jgi:hypothetical protein
LPWSFRREGILTNVNVSVLHGIIGLDVDIKNGIKKNFSKFLPKDFSSYLFIFDDLERLPEKFSYADVLFYVHSLLLESKNANVIFIADTSN